MPNRPHRIRSYDTSYQQVGSRVQDKDRSKALSHDLRAPRSWVLGGSRMLRTILINPSTYSSWKYCTQYIVDKSPHSLSSSASAGSLHALHFRISSSIFFIPCCSHTIIPPSPADPGARPPRPYITLSVCHPGRSISVLQGRGAEPRPPGAGGGGFHCHPASNGLFLGKPRSKTSRSSSLRSLTRGFRDDRSDHIPDCQVQSPVSGVCTDLLAGLNASAH
jgi:hypothetical protein